MMFARPRRSSRHALTAAPMVPAARHAERPWRFVAVLVAVAAATALLALAAPALWRDLTGQASDPQLQQALQAQQRLEQQLAAAQAALGVAQAHAGELEREVALLQQRVRECQEELLFFRKAGAAKP